MEIFNKILDFFDFLLPKLLSPLLIGFIVFKVIQYFTSKISLKEYIYNGEDVELDDIKIFWFNANYKYNIDKKNDKGQKIYQYSNDNYYFEIFTKISPNNISKYNEIDITDKKTYDFTTIVVFNKNIINFKNRLKLLSWSFSEVVKNKLAKYIKANREKKLPEFMVRCYVISDG
jgi:hypothetical protein